MKKIYFGFIFLLFVVHSSFSQNIPRIENSCYPYSSKPDTLYLVSENLTSSQRLTVVALQGLLAKTKPRIIRDSGIWPNELRSKYKIVLNKAYYSNFKGLIDHFKNQISGYILCDLNTSSANVAISISNIKNAIPVTPDLVSTMTSLGIPQLLDVRGKTDNWTIENYGNQLSKDITSYQNFEKVLCQSDYSVFSNSLQFWDALDSSPVSDAFNRMNANGVVMGWGPDEYGAVKALSQRGLVMNASDWAVNLSVLTNIPIEKFDQKAPVDSFKIVPNVHTVCFVMSDGDNIQWLLGAANDSKQFASPNRSKVNLGWTTSPALCELAPSVYKYYYDQAPNNSGGRNYFIAGPSGRGYNFPSLFSTSDINAECSILNNYMKKADLRIVNILDDSYKSTLLPIFLKQSNIDALFYYKYSNYSGLGGQITWFYNKPAIGGRYNLWHKTFESSSSLAKKLNALSTDIHSQNGYSLIPVHVWTMNVDSVISCVKKLNPTKVRVVAPDEFVWLIRQNLKHITLGQGDGLKGQYYNGKNFDTLMLERTDKVVDFDWRTFSPDSQMSSNGFSVRWMGKIQPVYSETYTFSVTSDDGVRLWVNDQLLIDQWQTKNASVLSGTIDLNANQKYSIKLEYFENDSAANCKLEWQSAKQVREVVPKNQLFLPNDGTTGNEIGYKTNGIGNLIIYPNPVTAQLNVNCDGSAVKNIRISDINGRILFSKDQQPQENSTIDISGFKSGIYLLKLQTDKNETIVRKFVK